MTGLLAGMCIGAAVAALLWDEEWKWKKFIKYQIAALGLIMGFYLLR